MPKSKLSREEQLLAQALYKPGDVVVTNCDVKVFDNRGRPDGSAAPGWLWRVVEVEVVQTGSGLSIRYAVVSHSAPGLYRGTLRARQIARKAEAQ